MKNYSAYMIVVLLLMRALTVDAQSANEGRPRPVIRLNLLGIAGFGLEQGIGHNFTLRPEAGLGWPVISTETNADDKTIVSLEYPLNPYLQMEARYYYNLNRRMAKHRRTQKFGADYVGCAYRYNAFEYQAGVSDDNRDKAGVLKRDVQYVAVGWGLQRTLGVKDHLYVNFEVGPGIKTNLKDYTEFACFSQLGFGFQW